MVDRKTCMDSLARLNAIPGISGREEAVGEEIARQLEGCYDEEKRDALGNRLFIRHGAAQGPVVMLCAHMDEIGFLVSDIDDEGYVYVVPVGHHDPRLLQNQMFTLYTAAGELPGVSGPDTAPHELKGAHPPAPGFGDLRLDVGARSRKSAENLGIAVGDAVTCRREGCMLGRDVFCGRAVDDRAGCTAMIGAMRLLQGGLGATVVACGTVQEELGAKGVRAAANALRPDIALSFDVCFGALDSRITPSHGRVYLGRGPAVQVYDWSPGSLLGNVVPARLLHRLAQTAKNCRIPIQLEVTLDGGTDAAEAALCGEGILSGGINLPNRYMHSAVGTVDIRDICHAAALAAAFCRGLDAPL